MAALIPLLLLLAAGLGGWGWLHHRRAMLEWQEREKNLLRTMREQESAHAALQVANRTLEQRARQLARSNAELERFAHVASHDLKEPVRTVISYTQLLSRKYSDSLDAEAQEYMRDAAEAARSIRARIESLLDFSSAGDLNSEHARTDSRRGVEKAIANLKPAIVETGATIHCDALPTVLAHPPEVALLFQNLLANAIKFRRDEAPEIHISAKRDDQPGLWRFCVRDNGIGIDPKSGERIFGLFQRLNPRELDPGLGMGLAICRKIVEGHGGRIWFEPAPGSNGSRFMFTLPAPA